MFAQSGFAYYVSWKAGRKLVLTPIQPVSGKHHFIRNVADVSVNTEAVQIKTDLSFPTIFAIHSWYRIESN